MPSDDTGLFGSASRTETADLLSSLQWYCVGNLPNRPYGPGPSSGPDVSASSSFDESPLLPLGSDEVGPLVDSPPSGTSASSADASSPLPPPDRRNAIVVVVVVYPVG